MSERRNSLLETESRELLSLYGLAMGEARFATTREAAVRAARELGYPVAAKLVSPQILHKSDAGGVKLGLKSGRQVRDAYSTIMSGAKAYDPDAEVLGLLLTPMQTGGVETIVGRAGAGQRSVLQLAILVGGRGQKWRIDRWAHQHGVVALAKGAGCDIESGDEAWQEDDIVTFNGPAVSILQTLENDFF